MKNILFILVVSIFILSGCAKQNRIEYIPVEITAPISMCHGETDLDALEYDKVSGHLGNDITQDIVQLNVLKLKNAYKLLYASTLCYDKQVKKSIELKQKQLVEFNKIKEGK